MSFAAALLLCGLLVALTIFQLGLIAGLPLGHLAWAGRYRVLPARLRFGSGMAILVYAVLALAILDRAGLVAILPSP